MISPVLLIPHFNHLAQLGGVIGHLQSLKLPLLLVDDGSDEHCWQELQVLCAQHDWIELYRLNPNRGKGAAVMFGLEQARRSGYSHALQFDADGQHDHNDIPNMLQLAQEQPQAIISGLPRFSDDMPRARRWGRKFTHLWCRIETLSGAIKDAMCGFRVYPVAASVQLGQRYSIAPRMGFDIDILVKAYWSKIPIAYLPTAVRYPEGGVSHFHYLHDNLAISALHTRLVLGMLLRSPGLLARHF